MYNITFINNKTKQKHTISNIPLADNFLKRLLGLMGKENFNGMIFKQKDHGRLNASIHTCFMKKTIDIIYINRDMLIEEIVTLPPWKLYIPKNGYIKYIIELPENNAKKYDLQHNSKVVINKCKNEEKTNPKALYKVQ